MQSTEIVPALARQIQDGKTNRTFVVVLSPIVSIPTELEKASVVIAHDLPDRQQPESIARGDQTVVPMPYSPYRRVYSFSTR